MEKDKQIMTIIEGQAIVKEAQRLLSAPSRRRFLRNGLTLGGIAMLTGCDLSDNANVEQALSRISRFNDRVQGWLFNGDRGAGLPGIDDHPAVPVQRFLRRGGRAGHQRRRLPAGGGRTGAGQTRTEPAAAAPDGAGQP